MTRHCIAPIWLMFAMLVELGLGFALGWMKRDMRP